MSRTSNVAQPTVINTELRPLDESFYIKANGQLEQWFYDNTSQYAPDRRIISLILTPELSVFDADTQSSYSTAVADTEDPEHLSFFVMQWFATEYNSTMSVTYAYAISASAETADSQTAPADVSSWSSTVVATTTAMPYAWVREVRTATVNGTSKTVTRYFCNTSGLTYTNTSGGGYWEEEITNITNSQTADYVISDNTLIVKKNVVYSHGVTIRCIATYIDPRDSGVTYTVQDTVTLTTNRDATVIYPEVAIASPSARTFNPLTDWKNVGGVDTQDSEFEFDGVVTNNPDVEHVISEDLAQYKVDGWGTEEIVSGTGGCSPTMTIRYPDGSIETDARFMYRKTADGNKLDMGGKFISWNQLLENGNFADTNGWSAIGSSASLSVSDNVATITKKTNAMNIGGVLYRSIANLNTSHKYYLSCIARTLANTHTLTIGFYNTNGTEGGNALNSTNSTSYTKLSSITSPKSNANVLALRCGISSSAAGVQANVHNCMCIDLTAIYGSGKEPTSVAQFESDYQMWFGKQLTYEPYDAGSQRQTLAPSNAFVTNIKGNTVPWNQLAQAHNELSFSSDTETWFRVTNLGYKPSVNHKIYLSAEIKKTTDFVASETGTGQRFTLQKQPGSFNGGAINVISIPKDNAYHKVSGIVSNANAANDSIAVQALNHTAGNMYIKNAMAIDLSLIYGDGREPTTVAAFEADYLKWFGKPLTYESYDAGSLKTVKMLSMKTVGFNFFDVNSHSPSNDSFDFTGTSGYKTKRIRLLPNTTYRVAAQVSAYSDYVILIHNNARVNETGYFDTRYVGNRSLNLTTGSDGYLYIGRNGGTNATSTARLREIKLTITLDTENSRNWLYQPYWSNKSMLNVTELKGRVVTNGQATGNPVTIFPDGMRGVLNVYDEIITQNGKIYAIKRIGSVNLGTYDWTYNSNYNMFYRGYVGAANAPQSAVCSKYYPMSNGRKAYNCIWNGYFLNPNSINIVDTSTTDPAVLKAKLNGVICHYPLSTAVKYEIDEIQSPFIFKWFGINSSGQEVDATTMPWYKEGQDTSKLKVDAMYGENINVVLRCTKGAGLNELSPSKAYASLSWRVPEIDCHVVSQNGQAVRTSTGSMTFGTTINVNGEVLSDNRRDAHLRFNWKYRASTSTTENDAGWGTTKEIANSNLIHVKSAVNATLASTIVYPKVYLLGAWKPATSTTTDYDKPTTTKDGVNYERTID